MKCETVFIYALCEPGTLEIRYIGQTRRLKTRFREHLRESPKKQSHLGPSPMKGQRRSPEVCKAISVGLSGPKHPMFGKHHSEAHKAAVSAKMAGRPKSPETRAAMSAARKGVPTGPLSYETRAAISAALKGVPWSPARRAAYEAGKLTKLAAK